MSLAAFRKSKGMTQADLARAIGLRSKGSICMIESGIRPASLEVALKIEKLSNGQVPAASICPAAAEIDLMHPAPAGAPPTQLSS